MSSNGSDKNFINVALESFFKPLLEITKSLPDVLAYALAVVLAILVIVLLGRIIPIELVVLVGVVVIAGLVAYIYTDINYRQPPSNSDTNGDEPPTGGIGTPVSGKAGILIDLSHKQDRWRTGSIFDLPAGTGNLISLIVPPPTELTWNIREIEKIEQFIVKDLTNWRGLIFGIPWHMEISQQVCDAIIQWVHQGGHLILMGYELGERHHRTNLNLFTDRAFGMRFNSDIVAPHDWSPPTSKPYGKEVIFDYIDSAKHSTLTDVKKLCMRNICTLTVEPGSSVILTVGRNGISREVEPRYTDGWTSSGSHHFELITSVNWFPVIAEAPRGLCGKGKVIAIGTWDFFSAEQCFKDSDNYTFVKNLLEWLVERK